MKKLISLLILLSLFTVACRTEASSLTGTWKLVSYGPSNAMTNAVPDAEATLTFNEDGTVGGNSGCNSFGGTYEVNGQTVTFSEMTSTLMACDEPRMSQEGAVTQVLSGSAQFEIQDQTLTLVNGDMNLVFTAGK